MLTNICFKTMDYDHKRWYSMDMSKSGKPTGFACKNCHTPVLEFEETFYYSTEDEGIHKGTINHCLCSRSLYKTNRSRSSIAKYCWEKLKK